MNKSPKTINNTRENHLKLTKIIYLVALQFLVSSNDNSHASFLYHIANDENKHSCPKPNAICKKASLRIMTLELMSRKFA